MIQEFSEQELIRRESLAKLKELGIEPYPAAQYPVNANAAQIAAEFDPEKGNFQEVCIADTLNITKRPLKEAAKELFGDEGYQVGFEVAGVESSIRSLMETIEKGSDIVVVAVFAKDPALSMFHLGEHELRLIGSMMYRHEDYQTAIDYVSRGIVNLEPLVSNRFAFEEYDDAYKFIDTHRETSMKVLIDFDQKPEEKK